MLVTMCACVRAHARACVCVHKKRGQIRQTILGLDFGGSSNTNRGIAGGFFLSPGGNRWEVLRQ